MNPRFYWIAGSLVVLGLVVAVGFWMRRPTIAPTVNNQNQSGNLNPSRLDSSNQNSQPLTDTSFFSTNDLVDRDPAFNFSASLPSGWVVEYVSASQAINIYDPASAGTSSLDQSQIFIKYFEASVFLTLTTVDIKSRAESIISGRPAVTYLIEKKSGAADFTAQPGWRNREHRVTDIRSTDAAPTVFYVFAQNPTVDDTLFTSFLNSVSFSSVGPTSQVVYPLERFLSRVTKKEFGQYVAPSNSPVQPERFSGFHTGVDAEVLATDTDDIPVYALADGTVRLAKTASGYGGVVVIEHQIDDRVVTAVYGHLRLASVRKSAGQFVRRAEQIAVLGSGDSPETDGERQHLHLGLLRGPRVELRGYVGSESALADWHDPMAWFAEHKAIDPVKV